MSGDGWRLSYDKTKGDEIAVEVPFDMDRFRHGPRASTPYIPSSDLIETEPMVYAMVNAEFTANQAAEFLAREVQRLHAEFTRYKMMCGMSMVIEGERRGANDDV